MRKTVFTAMAMAGALTASLPGAAPAADVSPTPVPAEIQVPPGNKAFLEGHALGTQDYVCVPAGSGFTWRLFTPQATLLDRADDQIITHFFGPNPVEDETIRAAWQHSGDTSTFWGAVVTPSTDPAFVEPGAIPWLLIRRAGVLAGPTGGRALTKTTFVQRVNTTGGVAPSTGCASPADVGRTAFVPYTADYVFFKGVADAY